MFSTEDEQHNKNLPYMMSNIQYVMLSTPVSEHMCVCIAVIILPHAAGMITYYELQ